jgi:NAD(P)-dependent dehydrogenase (short-subunit alcohol dehydrogenase family)
MTRDARSHQVTAPPEQIFRLDGRVAVVTGASSGLGERFARVLQAAGASVVVAARRQERLEALAEVSADMLPVQCDVSVPADLDSLVATTTERFGRLDILVNNAGISDPVVLAEDESLDDFRRVIDVNLVGTFHLARLAARHMRAAGQGSIVNIASVLAFGASAPIHQAGYCASKAAVVNLTRELAVQLARTGVRVNAIAPGYFASEMTADLMAEERGAAFVRRNIPMDRFGAPGELDGALLFLASDASTYCTGQTLVVDGGWTAR